MNHCLAITNGGPGGAGATLGQWSLVWGSRGEVRASKPKRPDIHPSCLLVDGGVDEANPRVRDIREGQTTPERLRGHIHAQLPDPRQDVAMGVRGDASEDGLRVACGTLGHDLLPAAPGMPQTGARGSPIPRQARPCCTRSPSAATRGLATR